MAVKNFRIFPLLLLLFFLHFVTTNAARRTDSYEKKYIEDACYSNESIRYMISDTGQPSAIKIGATSITWYSRHRDCIIEIVPTLGRGVILRVDSMYFGSLYDYVEVYGDRDNSTKLRGVRTTATFVSSGSMKLRYHTTSNNSLMSGVGFNMIATAYQKGYSVWGDDQFKCLSGQFIWKGFACDGIPNCPDSSDENEYGESSCVKPFTIKPLDIDWSEIFPTMTVNHDKRHSYVPMSFGIAALIPLAVLVRCLCFYYRDKLWGDICGTTIIQSRSSFPINLESPPPPYTSLVNEPAADMPTKPPDFSSVVNGSNAASGTSASSNTSQTGHANETLKLPSVGSSAVTEPPPPLSHKYVDCEFF